MDEQGIFAAMGEPTRFRIVTLLASGPRTVGEVAASLGALQPQTTKHFQALESAGLVRIDRLGRRRLASLNRETLRGLAGWLDRLSVASEDDRALESYAAGSAAAAARAASGDDLATTVVLERSLPASRAAVWRAWTDPRMAARWWAPRHFEVVRCAIRPEPGARVELALREGDGAVYASAGVVRETDPETRLRFSLSPVDAHGDALFEVELDVRLDGEGDETRVRVEIRAHGADADTAPMLAGLEPGWSQQLVRLEALLAAG